MANQPINVIYDFRSGAVTNKIATNGEDLVNKAQIESMIQGNISAKASVKVHAHGNVDLATGGLLTFDSYTLQDNDRVIVNDQIDPIENGIYIASESTWVRASDADEQAELQPFTYVFVTEGDHAGRKFQLINSVAPVVGTDPQNWDVVPIPANEATNTTIDTSMMTINASNVQEAVDRLDEEMEYNRDVLGTTAGRISAVVGTASGTLGSFTGTLIPDNTNVKMALQSVETALESVSNTVASSKFITPVDITITNGVWTTLTHNLSEQYLSGVQFFDAADNYTHVTHAFRWRPKNESSSEIEIYQDSGANRTIKVVARR